jgi:xylan 1,4-beta-xylosidase
MLILGLLVAILALGPYLSGSSEPTPGVSETITIDATGPSRPFSHFWETTFGSGRAILSLRDSYRQDLESVKRITGMKYVRFHAIFHDEVGLYSEGRANKPVYNFSYVDQIYDGLLARGIRPFVELSFMPRALAAHPDMLHPFWYRPCVSPPKDWSRWQQLIQRFVQHLVDRYGIGEVSQWYFEVWNEPNLDFWGGEPKETTYYELYDHAARGIKQVSPLLRVGGPATAQAAWVDRFIRHCVDQNIPVDFVSTHCYGNDSPMNVFGSSESIPRNQMVARAVKKVYDQVKSSLRPDLPIHWTEYNASYMNEVDVTDSPYMGPWLADTIRQCDGYATSMSYWTFSDVFEEQGVVKRPFYGGFGLIAAGHIPKAAYNAFMLLHHLGTERIPIDSNSVLATRNGDGSLALAVWNYAPPGEAGAPKSIRLTFRHLAGNPRLLIRVIDANHGSALSEWVAMGKPDFPTREQQRRLQEAALPPLPEARPLPMQDGSASTVLELQPHALALIEVGD